MNNKETPKLYGQLASWWPLLSSPVDYAEEAAYYHKVLIDACEQPPQTILELGSGGGNNASHLKAQFQMTLVDRSLEMLAVSRTLNPECEHVQGDMRTVRLGRLFDAVFIHDAIMYMTTLEDLRRAIETAWVHCKPGGAALLVPDCTRETFRPYTKHGGHDGDTKGMRYLEWVWDPNPLDTTFIVDFAYLIRQEDGEVQIEYDRHLFGLFSHEQWLKLLAEVGFRSRAIPYEHSEPHIGAGDVFVGVKPREHVKRERRLSAIDT